MRIARITGYVLCSLMLIYIAISLIGPGTFQLSASFMKSFLIVSWIGVVAGNLMIFYSYKDDKKQLRSRLYMMVAIILFAFAATILT